MPETMQAAFFAGERKLEVREVPVPAPGEGEVLIEVRACGICGSDLHQFAGRWPQPQFVPGHEIAGEIVALGPGCVREDTRAHATPAAWSVGDRVTVEPFIYCRACDYCEAGRYYQCPDMGFLTLTRDGGFAEQMTAPTYTLCRLPDHMDFLTGALTEPLAVGVHATRIVGVGEDDEVLVLGAGTIGLMTAAAARALGARQVAITARHEHQAEAARGLGLETVLSTDPDTLREQVAAMFPRGPSAVFETVGSAHGTFQQAVNLAGRLARVALLGANTGPVEQFDFSPLPRKELTVFAPLAYARLDDRRDFTVALELLSAEAERFEKLITHRFELQDIQRGFELASDKAHSGAVKVMMVR
jgi:L-iditol 2-dehydrogenase